ncbi:MAG: hypothetical protein J2P29_08665 [Actinobacteria bacterium]|nr:hypothetical protein [Actinomycetota bacterium]
MTPQELTWIEDELRRAYADASALVGDDDFGPGASVGVHAKWPVGSFGRGRPKGRWVAAAAAGVVVAAVAITTGLIVPHLVTGGTTGSGAGTRNTPVSAAVHGMAYLSTGGPPPTGKGPFQPSWQVTPMDLAAGTTLPPIKLGVRGNVTAMALTPDASTLYVLTDSGYIVPVDTVTRRAGQAVRLPGPVVDMLVSPDGRSAYILEEPGGNDQNFGGIIFFSLMTHRVTEFVKDTSAFQFALTPDGKALYVVDWSGSMVTPIDTATAKALPPIRTGVTGMSSGIAIAPNGRTAFVLTVSPATGGGSGFVTPIGTASNKALPSTNLGPISDAESGWGNTTQIQVSPDSRTVVIASDNEVAAMNAASGRVAWETALPANGPLLQFAISLDGQTVYALDQCSSRCPGGPAPSPLASIGGSTLAGQNVVYRLNTATGQQLTPINANTNRWDCYNIATGADGTPYLVCAGNPRLPGSIFAMAPIDGATGTLGKPVVFEPTWTWVGPVFTPP